MPYRLSFSSLLYTYVLSCYTLTVLLLKHPIIWASLFWCRRILHLRVVPLCCLKLSFLNTMSCIFRYVSCSSLIIVNQEESDHDEEKERMSKNQTYIGVNPKPPAPRVDSLLPNGNYLARWVYGCCINGSQPDKPTKHFHITLRTFYTYFFYWQWVIVMI